MPIKLTPDEIHMIHSIVTWKSQLIKSDMNLFTSFKRNKGNQRDCNSHTVLKWECKFTNRSHK